ESDFAARWNLDLADFQATLAAGRAALLEALAMACQVPVIGSDSGEIPYVIGDAGLVFPEGNVEELRSCLMQLMEQKELTEELGKKGYEKAMNQYTNQALARQLFNFYQELV
ncbi:MAG: glycosyltransferase family 4 protein, partial [Okeania sp. SIO4D6]|nr:glycosyltransferase family 4 protein [Okeania sp. SIO4D6]